MIDPKTIFQDDFEEFNSKLDYTYTWTKRSDNRYTRQELYDKYKDKLGWYVELYDLSIMDNNAVYKKYKPYIELLNDLEKLETLKDRINISLEHQFTKKGNNYILKKGTSIYKGTKYFYTPEQEKQFYESLPYGFYGDKYLAFFYARRYTGGVQVYQMKKDVKLFNVTNDDNIKYILKLLKKKFKRGKSSKLFFDDITYRELYKAIKVKYGVGINKYYQAYNISKYTKFKDIWLYEPNENDLPYYLNNSDNSYTGWYYGAGRIDRVCATGIMKLLQDKYDGITSQTGFYTPFSSNTGTEVIIWNQLDVLERKPDDKYDSMQFVKHLHFDPFKINFDINLSSKNTNFRIINFYLNHSIKNEKIKIKAKGTRILSINMHNFKSINLNDEPDFILEQLVELLEFHSIDICCCQEYYKELIIKSSKYNYIMNKSHIGLVIIYKSSIELTNIRSFKLPNEKFLDDNRFGLMFDYQDKKYCLTHLEIGKRFFDRSGSVYYADELYKIILFNYNIRKKQLDRILREEPDYIIGDFNFNPLDREYEYITSKGYTSGLVDYTTPFEKQVDFIFSKEPYDYFNKLDYPYSDHLPVMAIL